ncbi:MULTISPECIES: HAMP domain-containing sensor histidine kinase [unclassified Methylophilus]|uniref:HAMP domain-containing sensor histidine kinase n=1 Tax=unclassified Methylophilus TaxID=2630143 RepID=UPI00037D9C1C|nr:MULTISPECIES: HAMP domain-containing sensor histidine kinase [unclassified Methylophilus]
MNKVSIRWRIVIAFALITLFVAGAFTLGIYKIVHAMEDELLSQEMHAKLGLIVANPARSDDTLKTLGLHLFSADTPADPNISKYLVNLKPGFTEVEASPYSYYFYRQIIDGQDYILVQDQSMYEDGFERNLFLALKSGFFLTILLGILVGWLLARQIISPISRLSELFSRRTLDSLDDESIASKFSQDEIGQVAQAFEDAYARVKDALWRERLFTSDVSHEFRSGLMIISSSCELLMQSRAKDTADYARVERIARASLELQQLIESLLIVARAEYTAINPTKTQTLEQIAQEAFQRWQPGFEEKNIIFSLIKKQAPESRLLNADLLLTALSNLLKNALNYTHSGKVEIIINQASISVVDTGIGIDFDQQSQVLRPFIRGNELPLDGLGMGLSLVQRICENQGWRLSLFSEPGRGSTFTINL